MTSLFYNLIGLVLQPGGSDSSTPPPPSGGDYVPNAPGLPIDENIWLLVAMGILLGVYIIYKKSRSTNKVS